MGLSEQASLPPLGGSAGRFLDTAKGKLNAVDPDAWREKELKNKLHFSNVVQQKAALAVMNYLDCEKLKELEKEDSQNCLFLLRIIRLILLSFHLFHCENSMVNHVEDSQL